KWNTCNVYESKWLHSIKDLWKFEPVSKLSLLNLELPIFSMKNLLLFFLASFLLLTSCAPRSQYQTREGKAKNKYYNDIQYKKQGKWGKLKLILKIRFKTKQKVF